MSAAFKVIRSFKAYDDDIAIAHLRQIPDTSLLVSIGENLTADASLKVWALDKSDKASIDPKCLCTLKVQNGKRQFPVW